MRIGRIAAITLLALRSTVGAGQQLPPVQAVGRLTLANADLLSITDVRELSDGRVLVDDGTARRVLLFDRDLSHFIVAADSGVETARAYGGGAAPLYAYHGDTTLLVDLRSSAFVEIDGTGRIIGTIAIPRAEDEHSTTFATASELPAGG